MSARRTLALTLILIAIAVCVAGASAGTANAVTIEDVTLQPGATQEVPIRLLGSTGVSGVRVTLTFSTSIVNVTSVVAGDFGGMFNPDDLGVNNGVLKVTTMKSGQDLTGDRIIATITLDAAGDGGSCELGLRADLTDQSGKLVLSSVENGTLTVGSSAATTDNVTNESTFEAGDNPAVSTPTAAPTSPLTLAPSPTVTSSATITTTAANTAAPAAATTRSATTQTTTALAVGGDETMPDAPVKTELPGFEGVHCNRRTVCDHLCGDAAEEIADTTPN